jgi:hypothetical protein
MSFYPLIVLLISSLLFWVYFFYILNVRSIVRCKFMNVTLAAVYRYGLCVVKCCEAWVLCSLLHLYYTFSYSSHHWIHDGYKQCACTCVCVCVCVGYDRRSNEVKLVIVCIINVLPAVMLRFLVFHNVILCWLSSSWCFKHPVTHGTASYCEQLNTQ